MSHTVDVADIKSVAKHGTAKDGDLQVAEHGLYGGGDGVLCNCIMTRMFFVHSSLF